jgi:antirestriction protein ArdC
MKATEVYTEVTKKIVASLEQGEVDGTWTQPWDTTSLLPTNATTGAAYKGGNVLALWLAAIEHNYEGSYWATYRQWGEVNRQVRKGEKATYGIKWVEPKPKKNAPATPVVAGRPLTALNTRKLFPSGFSVFHYTQTEAIVARCSCEAVFTDTVEANAHAAVDHKVKTVQAWEPPVTVHVDPVAEAEEFFAAIGADVREGPQACYKFSPFDQIECPPIDAFTAANDYYATLAHEHTHWTGAERRLNRELKGFTTDPESYAREELIAELGAAFVCARLGLQTIPRPDHARYLKHWIGQLKADPKVLFNAASKAQAAVDYLFTNQREKVAA